MLIKMVYNKVGNWRNIKLVNHNYINNNKNNNNNKSNNNRNNNKRSNNNNKIQTQILMRI